MPSARRRWGVALAALACLLLVAWLARWSQVRSQALADPPLGPSARSAETDPRTRTSEVRPLAAESRQVERSPALPAPLAERRDASRRPDSDRFEVRVVDTQSQPVPGARVELRWSSRMSTPSPLQEGPVDAQGRWTGRIPQDDLPEPLELNRRELVLEARAAGHARKQLVRDLGELYDRRLPIVLELRPGRNLRGRVIDELGLPVPGCQMWLELESPRPGQAGVRMSADDSESDGSFELSVAQLRGRARIGAFSRAAGRARTPEFELAGDSEHLLQLEPGAVLAGSVSFPDGRPAPGMVVAARSLPDGRDQASGRSDDAGRFTLAALEPGRYLVTAGSGIEPPLRGSAHRCEAETPDRSIALVADQVLLEVRLRSSLGRYLRAAGVSCRRVDPGEEGILQAGLRTSADTSGSPPRARFVLTPGASYLIVADIPRCHSAQRLVRAGDLAGVQELDLDVFALDQVARVRPQFRGLAAQELELARVDVYDPYSRLCVRRDLEIDEQGLLALMTPGPWILRARRAAADVLDVLPRGLGAELELRPEVETPVWLQVD